MKSLLRWAALPWAVMAAVPVFAGDSAFAVMWNAGGDAPAPSGNSLWIFLNSAFGVWFLSSVVVASITAAYTRYQKYQTERTQKTTTQNRLNTEISSRIVSALAALRLEHKRINNGEKYWASGMYNEGLQYLDNRFKDQDGNTVDFSIYPEYQTKRFRSLIVELSAVAAPSMLPALREAQATYTRLEELADETPLHEDYSKDPVPGTAVAAIRDTCASLEILQGHEFWRAPL